MVNLTPAAPSMIRWSYDREKGMIYLRAGSFDLGSNTCSQRLFETPRIATSGGLIISVKKKKSKEVIKLLRENKFKHANIIGEMKKYNKNKLITVI